MIGRSAHRPAPPDVVDFKVQLFVPGKLVNPKNGGRMGHWRTRGEWAAEWRRKTRLVWLEAGRPTLDEWAKVTLTLYVARLWDRSNLALGVSPVQDEAMYLICRGAETRVGTDGRIQRIAPDGPQYGHVILIGQEVRPDKRGVLITVTPKAMRKLQIPDERDEIEYSAWVAGAEGNYGWAARFEENRGFIAIDQQRDDGQPQRVLLSPKQVKMLMKFIETFWK
jgi:hypothetical protein